MSQHLKDCDNEPEVIYPVKLSEVIEQDRKNLRT